MDLLGWVRQTASRMLPALAGGGGVKRLAVHASTAIPEYPKIDSASALAAFPLVRACFRAKSIDLASRPIIAQRRMANGRFERIPGHPVVQALSRAHYRRGPTHLRAQMCLDWWLTGDGYLYQISPELGDRSPLVRLHPELVEIEGNGWGLITGATYIIDGTRKKLDLDALVHVSDTSWQAGIASVLGTGAIQTLHQELTADIAIREMTTKAAQRGRTEVVISPTDPEADLTEDDVKALVAEYEMGRKTGSGAVAVSAAVSVTPVSLSPRDMEWAALNERTAAAIMAVSGVPPVRIGLPSANYGTSKQQMRNYWEGLQGEAQFLNEQLSRLDPDPDVFIVLDFSDVEALQQSRSERLQRVRMWWEMGAPADKAAEYEGFIDSPLGPDLFADTQQSVFRQPEKEPDEGQERGLPGLAGFLQEAAERYQLRTVASGGQHVPSADLELAWFHRSGVQLDEPSARELVQLVDESVRQHIEATPGAVRIDVAQCPVFRAPEAITKHLQEAA